MKRSALFLSLLLVLVLSFGAAAQLKLSGIAEFQFGLRQKWDSVEKKHGDIQFFGRGAQNLTLGWTAPKGSAGALTLTLGVSAGGSTGHNTNFFDWTTDGYNPGAKNAQFGLTSAKISGKGAFWKNGPELTLNAGRHAASYSPWVAHNNSRSPAGPNVAANAFLNSVEIAGFVAGPFTAKGIHGFAPTTGDQPTFLHAEGNVGGIATKLTAANRQLMGAGANPDSVWDFAVEAGMKPADNLTLDAAVAIDGQGRGYAGTAGTEVAPKMAVRLESKYTGIAATTLDGAVWRTDELFAPRYAQWARNNNAALSAYNKFEPDRQGFKVAGKTTQSGVNLNAGFEMANKISDPDWSSNVITAGVGTTVDIFTVSADVTLTDTNGAKSTKTILKASTKLADVNLAYTGEINKSGTNASTLKNTITAGTTRDFFFADKVALQATVIQGPGTNDLNYGADAKWTAPIGLDMTLGYANYKKSPAQHVQGAGIPDGFYLMAGKRISF